MKFLVLVLLCFVGALISLAVPSDWKYTFGFLVGDITFVTMDVLFYSKHK